MGNAHQTIRDMAAEAEKGQTSAVLRQFLSEQFPARPGGWLWRWLSGPLTYDVRKVESFEDGGFFRASCVFWVFVRDHFLEAAVLPSGGTYGLFALGARGLSYLNHQRESIELVLRNEDRSLGECAPLVLASFVTEALGRERNRSHDVLTSPEHLAEYSGDLGSFAGGYELNLREFDRVRTSLISPTTFGNEEAGWQLEFCSVFGWMHEKQTLMRHRYRFSPDFRIEQGGQILSRKIFKSTPAVRY